MHKQHPEQFLPGSGTVVQDCRDVVYTAGRAAKSFFGVGTVCVVPALPSAGKVQCVGRARRNRYNPAQTRASQWGGRGWRTLRSANTSLLRHKYKAEQERSNDSVNHASTDLYRWSYDAWTSGSAAGFHKIIFKSYSAYISISCSVPTMTSLTCLAEKREGGKEEQLSFAAELQTLHFSKLQL